MPDDDGIDIDFLVNSPDTSHWLQDDDEDGPSKVTQLEDIIIILFLLEYGDWLLFRFPLELVQ